MKCSCRFLSHFFIALLFFVFGFGGSILYFHYSDDFKKYFGFSFFQMVKSAEKEVSPAIPSSVSAPISFPALKAILEKAKPSVVRVHVTHRSDFFSWGISNIVRDMDNFFGRMNASLAVHTRHKQGTHSFFEGSGVVVSPDGYILTAGYLLYGASKIEVITSNQQSHLAHVVGFDPNSGLALIKIETKKALTPAIPARLSELSLSDWVISLGYSKSPTHGVIRSYTPRQFILTDAPLESKNVGGLLLNMKGEMLGINTEHIDFMTHCSFVIPADYAMKIAGELRQKGFVEPTYLGIVAENLTPDVVHSLHLPPNTTGVVVSQVMSGSPAGLAGVLPGDVITEFSGQKVTTLKSMYALVAGHDARHPVNLLVLRHNKPLTVPVQWPSSLPLSAHTPDFHEVPALGLSIREMLPQELKSAHTDSGLLVGHMPVSGPAYRVGIRSGDILIGMDGESLHTIAQFEKILKADIRSASFLFQRGSDRAFVAVEKRKVSR